MEKQHNESDKAKPEHQIEIWPILEFSESIVYYARIYELEHELIYEDICTHKHRDIE